MKPTPAPVAPTGPNTAAANRTAQVAEIRRQLGPTGKEKARK
jgi:hypothetical protein